MDHGVGKLPDFRFLWDESVVDDIVTIVADFIQSNKSWSIELIIPVPPSTTRSFQPVIIIAKNIARTLGIEYCSDCVTKIKNTPQLKNIFDAEERRKLLAGAFKVNSSKIQGKSILLFDDLYRSGATINEVSSSLQGCGKAKHIYALTLTKTRVHR